MSHPVPRPVPGDRPVPPQLGREPMDPPVPGRHRGRFQRRRFSWVSHLMSSALAIIVGVIVLTRAMSHEPDSPRDWIAQHFTRVAAATYQAPQPPLGLAEKIVYRFSTRDRVYAPGGVFLRYRDEIVAILPDGKGSRIFVDEPDRGYRRWHAAVGGQLGGPGGHPFSFRDYGLERGDK